MPAKGVHFYKPQTASELSQQARQFSYDPKASFSSWLRYADAIRKQADGYARQGEEQYAYLLYSRYRVLILELLPAHPEFGRDKQRQKDLIRPSETARSLFPVIEAARTSIDRRARHFSDAGRGREHQTATEKDMPPADKKRRRRKQHAPTVVTVDPTPRYRS